MSSNNYQIVIGLEVHVQLLTQTKLFCADALGFGAAPNTQVSAISLAHPGTLPMLNQQIIQSAVKLGLALNCTIAQHNYFARKNYFYPDLPKAYQISQHTTPICTGGAVPIVVNGAPTAVALTRIHIEEDAGKSLHDQDDNFTCIDLNRAGTPLLEIVTEPVIHSAEAAFAYVTEIRKLVRWLGISDGNMEQGNLRCDVNISVRPINTIALGTRVEIKNLNSIRNVKKAIEFEAQRLIQLTEVGTKIIQETRSFNADNNTTFSLRSKEDAEDYRYFADPDLTPFLITDTFLAQTKTALPQLPQAVQNHYTQNLGLSQYDAEQLTADKAITDYFTATLALNNNAKAIVNFITGPIKAYLNEQQIGIEALPLSPQQLANLITLVDTQAVSITNAQTKIFNAMLANPAATPLAIATNLNVLLVKNNATLQTWVQEVLAEMPDKVAEYKKGKKNLIGLFAGAVKKKSKGTADMAEVNNLLIKILNN
jgi:aspartyl-tRNA(Asn)/glutamyl-tRNA(Gln) amidotransferase subunit B